MPLTTLTLDAPAYATDDDMLASSPSDFEALVPHSQILASGSDGLFLADSPWTLRSPTVDFSDQDVTPGRVVKLLAASSTPGAASAVLTPAGKLAVVDSVIPGVSPTGGVMLRRPGEVGLFGQPYVTPGVPGVTGVRFSIMTFDRQLRAATAKVRNALKALAPDGVLVAQLDDSDLVELTVYRMLSDSYRDRMQMTGTTAGAPDPYAGKYQSYRADYKDKLAEIAARFDGPATVLDPATGRLVPRATLTTGTIRVFGATVLNEDF